MPVGETAEVAGHGSQDVLHVSAGQASIAASAQAVSSYVLREGGLGAGADRVSMLPLFGLLVEPVARLDLVQCLRQDCDGAGTSGG